MYIYNVFLWMICTHCHLFSYAHICTYIPTCMHAHTHPPTHSHKHVYTLQLQVKVVPMSLRSPISKVSLIQRERLTSLQQERLGVVHARHHLPPLFGAFGYHVTLLQNLKDIIVIK